MENNERRSPISTYANGKNEATTADENVAFAKVGVKLGSLARLKRELCESLGKSLENSTEMSISIKNSKHGLSLTVQNYDDGSGKISDDSSYIVRIEFFYKLLFTCLGDITELFVVGEKRISGEAQLHECRRRFFSTGIERSIYSGILCALYYLHYIYQHFLVQHTF